jgi:hypothetical protein
VSAALSGMHIGLIGMGPIRPIKPISSYTSYSYLLHRWLFTWGHLGAESANHHIDRRAPVDHRPVIDATDIAASVSTIDYGPIPRRNGADVSGREGRGDGSRRHYDCTRASISGSGTVRISRPIFSDGCGSITSRSRFGVWAGVDRTPLSGGGGSAIRSLRGGPARAHVGSPASGRGIFCSSAGGRTAHAVGARVADRGGEKEDRASDECAGRKEMRFHGGVQGLRAASIFAVVHISIFCAPFGGVKVKSAEVTGAERFQLEKVMRNCGWPVRWKVATNLRGS